MKISIIMGSPRRGGVSCYLAEQFADGAREAGHEVYMFNACTEPVAPCKGCGACKTTGNCVNFDAFDLLKSKLVDSDLIVFATPVYYFSCTAQLKLVIDRMYALNKDDLFGKRYALLTSSGSNMEFNAPVDAMFASIARWFTWKKIGEVNAVGAGDRQGCIDAGFGEQAHELGASL